MAAKSELYYHVVLTLKRRAKIPQDFAAVLPDSFARSAEICEAELLETAIADDHCHLLLRAQVTTYIPDLIMRIKGRSSREIPSLTWSSGYFIKTVGRSALKTAMEYISKQK